MEVGIKGEKSVDFHRLRRNGRRVPKTMDALTTDLDDFEYSETASSPGMIPIDLSSSTSIVSLSERLHFFFLFFCLDF